MEIRDAIVKRIYGRRYRGSNEITDLLPDLFPRFLESTFAEAFRSVDEIVQICEQLRFSKSLRIFFPFFFSFFPRRRVNIFNDEFFSLIDPQGSANGSLLFRLTIRGLKEDG